jgi:hypothetical protein
MNRLTDVVGLAKGMDNSGQTIIGVRDADQALGRGFLTSAEEVDDSVRTSESL